MVDPFEHRQKFFSAAADSHSCRQLHILGDWKDFEVFWRNSEEERSFAHLADPHNVEADNIGVGPVAFLSRPICFARCDCCQADLMTDQHSTPVGTDRVGDESARQSDFDDSQLGVILYGSDVQSDISGDCRTAVDLL